MNITSAGLGPFLVFLGAEDDAEAPVLVLATTDPFPPPGDDSDPRRLRRP